VAIADKAVLLAGPSGVGKSDLALRLIDGGARLVADDQTALRAEAGRLYAAPPQSIEGLIEVRHVGILRLPFIAAAAVELYIDLTSLDAGLQRLPDEETLSLLDVPVRRLRLPAFAASTPAKIRAALTYGSYDARRTDDRKLR
jgi:serine kinase of HPr protein (carbohydrate metabolism regulator)